MLAWIMANKEIVGIGALLLYAMLPANSPIKAFLNKIIGGILPQPNPPGPVPPGPVGPVIPVPTPAGLDWQMIMQLLMGVLLKAKASGDVKTQEAVLAVLDQAKAEHDEAIKSATPPPSVRYYQAAPGYYR